MNDTPDGGPPRLQAKVQEIPNGFSTCTDYFTTPAAATQFLISESVRLGHRIASEGKDITEVRTYAMFNFERHQHELTVQAKIKHRIKQDP